MCFYLAILCLDWVYAKCNNYCKKILLSIYFKCTFCLQLFANSFDKHAKYFSSTTKPAFTVLKFLVNQQVFYLSCLGLYPTIHAVQKMRFLYLWAWQSYSSLSRQARWPRETSFTLSKNEKETTLLRNWCLGKSV